MLLSKCVQGTIYIIIYKKEFGFQIKFWLLVSILWKGFLHLKKYYWELLNYHLIELQDLLFKKYNDSTLDEHSVLWHNHFGFVDCSYLYT